MNKNLPGDCQVLYGVKLRDGGYRKLDPYVTEVEDENFEILGLNSPYGVYDIPLTRKK